MDDEQIIGGDLIFLSQLVCLVSLLRNSATDVLVHQCLQLREIVEDVNPITLIYCQLTRL